MAQSPSNAGSSKAGAAPTGDASTPVVIKKYANRRLYNTETSSYITLEHLATMTREGRDFQVFDARTGEDITRSVLTQIVMEEEATGQTMLPVPFLRQIIAMYGDSMQAMVPGYLEASMDSFRRNQEQFKSAVEGAFANSPFAELAKRNMAMFEAAAEAFKPGANAATPPAPPPAPAPERSKDDEIAALKAQLAALKDQVDKLS